MSRPLTWMPNESSEALSVSELCRSSRPSTELLLCGHVSKAVDVYAYGVLLFELFTGERAWEGMPRALLPARVRAGRGLLYGAGECRGAGLRWGRW